MLDCGICLREGLKSEPLDTVGGSTRLALAGSRLVPLSFPFAPAPLGVGVLGTPSWVTGEAILCFRWQAAQRDQPGGNPRAATLPLAMPQHGSHPIAALVTMPGTTLPSRPGGGGSRPPWDVATNLGLTTRSTTRKEVLRTGGEDAETIRGQGATGGSPEEDAAPCVSDLLLPTRLKDTHGPCKGMPWSTVSKGIPRKRVLGTS